MEGSGYEDKVLHYMSLLTGYLTTEEPKCERSEPNSDDDAPANDLHQRYLDYEHRKQQRAALPDLQPRSLRKATKIVNSTIAYGLANGILTKKGPGLYLNHGELNPTQNVEEDTPMPSSSRVEPEQGASNVHGERTNEVVPSHLSSIKKESPTNGNLPRVTRARVNSGVKGGKDKKRRH